MSKINRQIDYRQKLHMKIFPAAGLCALNSYYAKKPSEARRCGILHYPAVVHFVVARRYMDMSGKHRTHNILVVVYKL